MATPPNPALIDAKERLDRLIANARSQGLMPITIAETLFHVRGGTARLSEADSVRKNSYHWCAAMNQRLFKKGLAARRDVEAARIKYKELRGYQASAAADLAKAETAVSRQATQLITAPRDGMILRTANADTSTYIKEGDVLVTFAPQSVSRAVEIYVSGLDAVLVRPGRQVRLMFEGWPAVQFSGWPSVAVGTFAGVVQYVDPAVSINGRYRIVVVEPPGEPWPGDHYLRLGGKVRGWVLLNEVRLGYEIWRQLNYFPPEPTVAADPRGGSGEASSK